MKPIKLIISSFGPYAGLMPEINFERFEDKGLFLITGDTGSGKTMLFDAVCFALYGDTSCHYRDKEHLRSEYADAKQKSFVDFYFSHQGHEYHVYREPSYEYEKKRGEGTARKAGSAVLYADGAPIADGLTNVNKKIVDLLKIDDKQFKQIAMIAQGEFWDLLNADTKERTEILRTIFNTSGYNQIAERLFNRVKNNESMVHDAEKSIVQYFDDVIAEPEDEHYADLTELQEKARNTGSAWNIDDMIAVIDTLVASDNVKRESVKKDLSKAEKAQKELDAKYATAETNNKFIERVQELEKQAEKLKEQQKEMTDLEALLNRQKAASREVNPSFVAWDNKRNEIAVTKEQINKKLADNANAEKKAKEAEEALSEAEKRRPELEELNKRIDKISEEETKYRQRDDLSKKLKDLEEADKKNKDADASIKAEEAALKEKVYSLQKTIEDLKNKPIERQKAETEGKELKSHSEEIKAILDARVKECKKRRDDLKLKQDKYKKSFEAYEKANADLINAEKIIEGNKAGILAKDLQDGQPCPVCGSTHHPHLAVIPETDISEKEFEALKKKETDLQTKKADDNTAAEIAKNTLGEYEEQMRSDILDALLKTSFKEDSEGKSLDDLVVVLGKADTEISEKINANEAVYIQLSKDCDRLDKAQKELAKAGEKTEEIGNRKQQLSESNSAVEKALAETSATLKTLEKLSYADWKTASGEMNKAKKLAEEINKKLEDAVSGKTKADNEKTATASALKTLNDTLQTQTNDEKILKEVLDEKLSAQKFASVEEMRALAVPEGELTKTENKINKYKQDVSTNETQLKQAREDAKGKTVIDLEELKTKCAEQEKAVKEIRAVENKISNRISINNEKKKNISDQKAGLEKSRKEYYICKRLSDLARGNTGKGKITLEQYIQAAGFDGIIAAANRRLTPMSDGQFRLLRKDDQLSKKTGNFLDLEVFDYHTGHKRPVGNLSGGESFKASLSLALGLSDTVSSNNGGVQMDALFVDEGFGTLDKKSIDTAIEILENLTGANKLVGVISHREELIAAVPESQQIRVIKTSTGSKLDFPDPD